MNAILREENAEMMTEAYDAACKHREGPEEHEVHRSVEKEDRAKRAAVVSSFKSILRDNKGISLTSRWS
ncbi:hypothetical protein L1987_25532 [Smallanthus sonchifolius]|uniref:Uncharacterized protein n=1 Tax=Smallanthus sonchifolius TaxID=185202 RepID=A0ACB9IQF4_9ASTR|nr:hypothetical protein L1987_25532 [Smallanthus sonchifolius]